MHMIYKVRDILLQKKSEGIVVEKFLIEDMVGKMDQTLKRLQQSPPYVLFRTDYLE